MFDIKKKKSDLTVLEKTSTLASPGSHLELVNICSPDFFNFKWRMARCRRRSYGRCHYFQRRRPKPQVHSSRNGRMAGRGESRCEVGDTAEGLTRSSPVIFLGAHTRLVLRRNPCMVKPYPRGWCQLTPQDNKTKARASRPLLSVFHIPPNLPSYMALFYGFIAWAFRLTLVQTRCVLCAVVVRWKKKKNDGGQKWHFLSFGLDGVTFSSRVNTAAQNMTRAQRLYFRTVCVWQSCSCKRTADHQYNQRGVNTFISCQAWED